MSLAVAACLQSLPAELTLPIPEHSIRVEDRDGHLLREVRSPQGAVLNWVPLASIPNDFKDLLIATEDRRFRSHHGIDVLAVVRAAVNNVYRGRITSGASTLTMQLARTLRPHRRNLWGKFEEMALALRIEATLSKSRILEEYINRVDFGPNLRGIGAASHGYFGKPAAALSISQSATLVGMLKGPSVYALDRHPDRALARRDRVIERALEIGVLSQQAAERARSEGLHLDRRRSAFGAPHFVSALVHGQLRPLLSGRGGAEPTQASRIRTTIDSTLQRAAESAILAITASLGKRHVNAASALVVDNDTGDVLAYVGAPNFYDPDHQGQVDGVRARRQPGSALKPFVYAAAFEELGYTAATVLPDLPLTLSTAAGDYTPRNFDDKYRGPVRVREALGNSLNVPAVFVASELGAPTLLRVLHSFGFDSLTESPEYYGPALALGDGEVTLIELVRAYSALARGGVALPLRCVLEQDVVRQKGGVAVETQSFDVPPAPRVTSVAIASVLTDILKDKTARLAAFGAQSPLQFDFEVAAKTGTSKGFRDNWVIGFTRKYTVGVWAGNFDGSSMQQVTGITGAGPIFHSILLAATAGQPDERLAVSVGEQDIKRSEAALGVKRVSVCPISGQLAGADCPHAIFEFVPVDAQLTLCQWHQTLLLDRRNGMLAGPGCASSETVRKRFEILPPEYATWEKLAGREPPPYQYSEHCPAPEGASGGPLGRVTILEPRDGARFVIDPDHDRALQSLAITLAVPAQANEVRLELDGRNLARLKRPFVFHWQLQAGHHKFVAIDPSGAQSDPVQIDVREAQQ